MNQKERGVFKMNIANPRTEEAQKALRDGIRLTIDLINKAFEENDINAKVHVNIPVGAGEIKVGIDIFDVEDNEPLELKVSKWKAFIREIKKKRV